MGLYLRKSVSVGPFRFNLSNSGVGMSVGVRGLRVGAGPRGNYVRIGRGGVYYQQTLPAPATPAPPVAPPRLPAVPSGTHVPLETIESADAVRIVDSTSEHLLAEIRDKSRLMSLTPLVTIASVILFLFVLTAGSGAADLVMLFAAILAIVAAKNRDTLRKTVVVLYDFTPEVEEAFRRFGEWCAAVAGCRRAWQVTASGRVFDRKYHAGASELIQRNAASLRMTAPPGIRTNVPVLSIAAGRQTLYFLPDRLLVYDQHGVGAVSYATLQIDVTNERFIEDTTPPGDARVVDWTWRYVNKNGGPDRRFASNPQLPICLYGELSFRTTSGLHEVVQISRCDLGEGFAAAVRHLGMLAQNSAA